MIHQIDFDTFFFAILLTLIAGMSTGVGALMAFLTRKDNKRVLSWALGLSAGVMVYISFMEMLPEAMADMKSHFPILPVDGMAFWHFSQASVSLLSSTG